MKILHVETEDCDTDQEWLRGRSAEIFRNGDFTHIENQGSIYKAEVLGASVSIGKEVCYIEDFELSYVHYDRVIDVVCTAWKGERRLYNDDPMELIYDLIEERDKLYDACKRAQSLICMEDSPEDTIIQETIEALQAVIDEVEGSE
ncbi:MAG: hypothetical protein K9J79_03705 [Desulfobacteraceae bacterium]|nr:hypothetical protein [Desulfobacteraceae bacterium]